MKRRLTCLVAVVAMLSAGCGIGSTGPVRAGAPASGLREPGSVHHYAQLYFVSPYGIQAVTRQVDTPLTPQQALDLLLNGPDAAERARGLTTEVPPLDGLIAHGANGAVNLNNPPTWTYGSTRRVTRGPGPFAATRRATSFPCPHRSLSSHRRGTKECLHHWRSGSGRRRPQRDQRTAPHGGVIAAAHPPWELLDSSAGG